MLHLTHSTTNDPTTNECYNEQFLSIKSGCCIYNMLQRTILQRTNVTTNSCINKIRILPRTQLLQRTRKNTISRRRTRVRMTCRAFSLRLEHQLSSFLSLVRLCYQFSSVICLFAPLVLKDIFLIILIYNFNHEPQLFMLFKFTYTAY